MRQVPVGIQENKFLDKCLCKVQARINLVGGIEKQERGGGVQTVVTHDVDTEYKFADILRSSALNIEKCWKTPKKSFGNIQRE